VREIVISRAHRRPKKDSSVVDEEVGDAVVADDVPGRRRLGPEGEGGDGQEEADVGGDDLPVMAGVEDDGVRREVCGRNGWTAR
jgi:hypothetical protein